MGQSKYIGRNWISWYVYTPLERSRALLVPGVLLVDPTVEEGCPLWESSRNFSNNPNLMQSFKSPTRRSIFENVIYWTKNLCPRDIATIPTNPSIMAFRTLQLICAEWLTFTTYVTTRLTQIEYELKEPPFREDPSGIKSSLDKLHTWHLRVPIYNTMLRETVETVFRDRPLVLKETAVVDCMQKLRVDFEHAYNEMERRGQRIEGIMTLAMAIVSIEESRRAIQQNHTFGRLTYLAVVFAPLSFISSLFSMTADLGALKETFGVYVSVAIPVSMIVLCFVDFERLRMCLGRWRTPRYDKMRQVVDNREV